MTTPGPIPLPEFTQKNEEIERLQMPPWPVRALKTALFPRGRWRRLPGLPLHPENDPGFLLFPVLTLPIFFVEPLHLFRGKELFRPFGKVRAVVVFGLKRMVQGFLSQLFRRLPPLS